MKTYISFLLAVVTSFASAQNTNCDKTANILKKIFPKYELKNIQGRKVFVTEVWDNHATIPLNNCRLIELDEGVKAISFEIFLTDVPDDYENMLKDGITIDSQINEESTYKGYGERLIQVILYDTEEDKFIGKPDGFPIAELTWIEQLMNGSVRTDKIIDFKKIENCSNTLLLSIEEFKDSKKKMHYFFKYHDGKIMTKSLNTCIESIQEQKNLLMVHHIENCIEVEEEGAVPENVFRIIFKW